MSVSILIISHGNIGQATLDAAIEIIGSLPMQVKAISVDTNSDYDSILASAQSAADEMNSDDGILMLTDLYGSTPSNIANIIHNKNSILIAGLNLPMLIRVLNYYDLPLYELCDKAISGGKDGVLAYYTDANMNNAKRKN